MRKWFLIVTKPHKETYAEEQLNNQGFETYHALFIQKKKIRGKLKSREASLFPRYLFIRLNEGLDDWSSIRSTRGVLNIVRFGTQPAHVPDELIAQLKASEETKRKIAEGLEKFKSGDKVIIDNGPFADVEGIFERYDKDERVILLLNILQQQEIPVSVSLLDINKTE